MGTASGRKSKGKDKKGSGEEHTASVTEVPGAQDCPNEGCVCLRDEQGWVVKIKE